MSHELLTVNEVAKVLRVDDTTVRRWIKTGALEAVTLPHAKKRHAYRIKRSTLDTLLGNAQPEHGYSHTVVLSHTGGLS